MGIWNREAKRVEPAIGSVPGCPYATVSYMGKTYLFMNDSKLVDPETETVVGKYNADTGTVTFGEQKEEEADIKIYDPAFDDDEPIHPSEYLERGNQTFRRGRFRAAACLYEEALKGCGRLRSIDL